MAAAQKSYFPSPRTDLTAKLAEGDEVLDAAMVGTEQAIPAGHVLVRAGEPHGTLYRLVSGNVARIRAIEDGRRQIICIFSPGDLLAVKALMLDSQPDDIEALSEAVIRKLDYREALALAAQHPSVSLRYMWQLGEDERRLHNSVTLLGRGNALERVCTVLLDLQARLVVMGGQHGPIQIRQQQLADYVGLTIVHVNRTIRSLREQGAVETRKGALHVRDITTLYKHAAPMLDIFEREHPVFKGSF